MSRPYQAVRAISIHAPRTGSDPQGARHRLPRHISIHAPRTGSDRLRLPRHAPGDISIHAPRTGSDIILATVTFSRYEISIHAPRTGSDINVLDPAKHKATISIHAPRTGSDSHPPHLHRRHRISIHAPRTGSDTVIAARRRRTGHFNPRSPHGERPLEQVGDVVGVTFQSTLPARGATRRQP